MTRKKSGFVGGQRQPPVALTIAGFDPGGGAGVTADLLTFHAHGVYGVAAITALTVQSTLGVSAVHPVGSDVLRATLAALTSDQPPVGIKIGMLATNLNVASVLKFLEHSSVASKPNALIVLDPVIESSTRASLLDLAGREALRCNLLGSVDFVTPNWHELALLAGMPVASEGEAIGAAEALGRLHPRLHVVVTGGDQAQPVDLLRLPTGETLRFVGERVQSTSTHGTGCAFSSALLCELIAGQTPSEAVRKAKRFVETAIRSAPKVGQGKGPMDLLWPLRTGL